MNTAVEIPRCHVCGCSPPHPPAACPLVESVEYHRNGAVAKITKRPPAPAADREKPDRCRAPHCWSEYGTPCGTCPVEKSETPFFTEQQERNLARCEAFDRASEPRKETT